MHSRVKGSCSCACHDGIWGSVHIAPLILNVSTRWGWGEGISLYDIKWLDNYLKKNYEECGRK